MYARVRPSPSTIHSESLASLQSREGVSSSAERRKGSSATVSLLSKSGGVIAKAFAVVVILVVADTLTDHLAVIIDGEVQHADEKGNVATRRQGKLTTTPSSTTKAAVVDENVTTTSTTTKAAVELDLPKDDLGQVMYKSEWPQKAIVPQESRKRTASTNVNSVRDKVAEMRARLRGVIQQKTSRVQQLRGMAPHHVQKAGGGGNCGDSLANLAKFRALKTQSRSHATSSFVIGGVAGPRRYKDPISDAQSIQTLKRLVELAYSIGGVADVAIVGAEDQFLKAMKAINCTSRCHFEYDEAQTGGRVEKIARARNQLLRHAKSKAYDFMIMTDLDGSCRYNASVLTAIVDTEYDMLSFTPNSQDYWDLYALRAPWYPENRWGPRSRCNPAKWKVNDIMRQAREARAVVDVESAFMMAAVYRVSALLGSACAYGSISKDRNLECEHVVFNSCLRREAPRRMFGILPVTYCM
ncbi:hypothetical protein RI054_02g08210 [Pseudoscourfieldia marina]